MPAGPPATGAPVFTGSQVPDSLQQMLKLTKYQLRDYLRARRFLILFLLVFAIGAIVTAVVGYYRPAGWLGSTSELYGNTWGGAASFVIVLAAVFFGGDAIAGEFQNRTGYFLMGLPLRRAAVYAGKYIAAFIASLAILTAYLVITVANGVFYFGAGAFPWQLGYSYALAVVYLLAVLGTTFLFSSLFKVSTYGTLLTAILFLFGFSLLQALLSGLAHVTPWFVISYADTVIGAVLSSNCIDQPGAHQCATAGPGGQSFQISVNNPTVPMGVAIMIGYFLITSLIGLLQFEREQFS